MPAMDSYVTKQESLEQDYVFVRVIHSNIFSDVEIGTCFGRFLLSSAASHYCVFLHIVFRTRMYFAAWCGARRAGGLRSTPDAARASVRCAYGLREDSLEGVNCVSE